MELYFCSIHEVMVGAGFIEGVCDYCGGSLTDEDHTDMVEYHDQQAEEAANDPREQEAMIEMMRLDEQDYMDSL